jgi:hypothetical protein
MFESYRDDNEDVEFKFIHIFKRIETCEKGTGTRVALTKAKEGVLYPIAVAPMASEGLPIGNKTTKLARDRALATKRLQSFIVKCNTDAAVREEMKANIAAARKETAGRRWSAMLEKQEVKIDLLKANIGAKKQKENWCF